MKIALIVEWLDTWRGGAETSTQQFIHHLVDLGVSLSVFTRSQVNPRPGMGVETIATSGLTRGQQAADFRRKADAAAQASDCELIHSFTPSRTAHVYQPRGGTVPETMLRNLAVRQSGGARAVKRLAMGWNRKQRRQAAEERAMLMRENGPIVLALSDYVIDQLRRHYHLPDGRIRKVYNGIDPDGSGPDVKAAHRRELREQHGVPEDAVLVLMVAHNFKLKGVRTLIEALAQLRAEGVTDVRAMVVGKDRSAPWYAEAVRRGLGEMLKFPGSTQRVQAFMHAADVLVHPTFYDPCSRVVLEALASGLPAITTRFDGASEMVQDGENGYVLEASEDSAALAQRILKMRDAGLRSRMSEAARGVRDKVRMVRHAREVVDVYRTLLPAAVNR